MGGLLAHVPHPPCTAMTERHVDLANKADQIEDKGLATYSFYYT
jgi:hypothetical protein